MYIENIKRNPATCWTNYFGDVMLPGDTTGRDANALPSHMTPAYTALNLDSGVGEQVATIGGQYGILLTVLYDRDWILDTVDTFHPNVSESAVVELFGAALPCIADAMSDDLRDLLKDNGAARMRDDVHILYGQNTDVDGHELFVFVPFNPDSDICAKAVRIIEKYLNGNAYGENVMRCIRALVKAADIDSLINN